MAHSARACLGRKGCRTRASCRRGADPLSRSGEGQGEGTGLSGEVAPLTPTLSRTGEGAVPHRERAIRGRPAEMRARQPASGAGRTRRASARTPRLLGDGALRDVEAGRGLRGRILARRGFR
ncbi:hypothetical protein FV223_28800, partial [Methylobacterium sp. WL116]